MSLSELQEWLRRARVSSSQGDAQDCLLLAGAAKDTARAIFRIRQKQEAEAYNRLQEAEDYYDEAYSHATKIVDEMRKMGFDEHSLPGALNVYATHNPIAPVFDPALSNLQWWLDYYRDLLRSKEVLIEMLDESYVQATIEAEAARQRWEDVLSEIRKLWGWAGEPDWISPAILDADDFMDV